MHVQDDILLGMCRICNDIVANDYVGEGSGFPTSRLGLGLGLAKYNMLGWARVNRLWLGLGLGLGLAI